MFKEIYGGVVYSAKEYGKGVKINGVFVDSLSQVYSIDSKGESSDQRANVSNFKFKGGYANVGKGTPEGDGKDKAMRQIADSAIVELTSNKPSSKANFERDLLMYYIFRQIVSVRFFIKIQCA